MEWSGFVLNVNVTGKLARTEGAMEKRGTAHGFFLLDHDVVAVVLVVVGCAMLQSHL